jgi:hypothetical protein
VFSVWFNLLGMVKETIENILIATFKIQSALHSLDKIEIKNEFKQRKKQELNLLLETLRNIVTMQEIDINYYFADKDLEQAQNYADIVNEFDKLGDTIKIEL